MVGKSKLIHFAQLNVHLGRVTNIILHVFRAQIVKPHMCMLPRLAFIFIFHLYHKFSRSESEAELLNPHVVDGVSAGMFDKDKSVSGQGTTLWQVSMP